MPNALCATREPARPANELAIFGATLAATFPPTLPSTEPTPGIMPNAPPTSMAVPRPSFQLLPAARLDVIWPAPALIAPMTAPATTSTARPEPNVAITNAVSATATIKLTQKPGSVSIFATNSNAALSFSAIHFAALTILPQRPFGFSGSFVASALTFAWPWETLPELSPGILAVPPWTLDACASISPLVVLRPDVNFCLTLPTPALTFVPYWVTVWLPVVAAPVAVLLTWVETLPATPVAVLDAPPAVDAAEELAEEAWSRGRTSRSWTRRTRHPRRPWRSCPRRRCPGWRPA